MNQSWRSLPVQSRLLLVALVVFLCSAAPVLADDGDEQASSPNAAPEAVAIPEVGGPPHGPDGEAITEAFRLAEQKEQERDEVLTSPAAVLSVLGNPELLLYS